MISDITFGQYYQSNSLIHRLDPRVKILLLVLIMVFMFIASDFYALGLMTLLVIFAIIFSRVPIKLYFKNLKAIIPIVVFTTVINLFYIGEGKVLFEYWKIRVTTGGIERALFLTLRIVLLIVIGSILTYTTTPNDLTDAIERLFYPLRFIGLKRAVHVMAMMMTIALRFIPTLVEETEKIMNAQKARGANLEDGNLLKKIKALIPILVPLLISAIRHAYELSEAMECRCYNNGEGRVRMKKLKLHIRDALISLCCVAFCGGVLCINILL